MRNVIVYLAEGNAGIDDIFLLTSYRSAGIPPSSFLFSPTSKLTYDFVLTSDAEEAGLVLLPQPVFNESQETRDYLQRVRESTEVYGIPRALVIGGDYSHLLNFPGFVIFKGTQYRRFLKDNEVIIPPFCEDLGESYGVTVRHKGAKPVVSFCGWAGFDTKVRYLKYVVRLMAVEFDKLVHLDASREVFKKGLFFRRKAVHMLERSSLVTTNFIIRRSFSGHAKTIELSPEQVRTEYVQNMVDSDFVLAPKGDANYSVRFFEALSLGRIPILIDTECCLPLEGEIDYSKCVLRVSYKDINRIPEIVSEYYNNLTDEEFVGMQEEARRVFAEYLRYDSFFNRVLPKVVNKIPIK
jgi:hypothetical protein